MRTALVLSSLALVLAASSAFALDGELDPAFGATGQVVFPVGWSPAHARDAVVTDAGLVVVGDLEAWPGDLDFFAERLDFSGDVVGDSGSIPFNLVASGADFAEAVAGAPGGKVVIAGTVEAGGGLTYLGVVRLDAATLTLDNTFGTGGQVVVGIPSYVFNDPDVAVLADGSVLVGCTYGDSALTNRDFGVFKLHPDGTRDASFGSGGLATVAFDFGADHIDLFRALAVQPDGKIVLAGAAQWGATDYDFAAARLLPNGQLDTGFGPYGTGKQFVPFDLDGNATDLAEDVAIAADGRIALAGSASQTPVQQGAVAMLNRYGNLDTSFDSDGRQEVAWIGGAGANDVTGVAFESDGTLFLSGNAYLVWGSQGNLGVARLLPDGRYDCTFHGCFHMYNLDAGWEYSDATALDGGRPLLVGTRAGDWAIIRLTNTLVFRDGFENGSTSAWSSAAG
jgi:uncharacterized delta-60 repeat protein